MRSITNLCLLWLAACCAGCIGDGGPSFDGAAAEPTIVTTSLADGQVGAAYMAPLQATGGSPPYVWSISSGQLPAGLALDSSGVVSGTPTNAADMDFSVAVLDSKSTGVRGKFRLLVHPVPVSITAARQLPNGVVGTAYSLTLTGAGGTPPYSWQVTAGSLPAGLGLDAATGLIFGTPTGVVTASPTITLTDADTASANATFSLQIFPAAAPTITTALQLPSSVMGTAYSVTLTAAGGTPPYRWQVTAGALPAGLNLNQATGVIAGTATSAGTATPTIAVADANNSSASAAFSLRIFPTPPAITTAAQLPNGVNGTAYSTTLAASGGTPPYRWQVTAGSLPAGLGLNQNTGVIAGTPTSVGTATPTITVTDANSASGSTAFSLRINPAPIVITTAAPLPNGVNGTAYSAPLAATGGIPPYRWQVTAGSLPAGLALDAPTGVIFGTPTSVVTASPTITVTDTANVSVSAAFSLRINPAPVAITTTAQLPGGVNGTAYSTTLAATGGTTPYRWQVTAGSLPAGLNLNQTTGVISGTPTGSGTANPTITVTDANSVSASVAFSLQVAPAAIAITSASTFPDGVIGTAYSTTLAATGGTPPYRWQVTLGTLPAGLGLNQSTGVISGTPTSAVTASLMIAVTDANNASVSAAFSLRIPPSAVVITTTAQLPNGALSTAYSVTLAASGGTPPYSWQVTSGSLPAGLGLNATTGVISGTPTSVLTANPTITVTDANSVSASTAFFLQVLASPVVITTAPTLPDGVIGTAYSATLAATGGIPPYHWQVTSGSLPAGLGLNATTGVISGTPTGTGTANPTITVADALSASTSAAFALTIKTSGTGWQLVWSDEFDGTTLDSSKWLNPHPNNSCNGYNLQTVMGDDTYLDGSGHLVVRAQSRASGGCGPMHLTAGQISTANRFSQAYGRFEFRAQMPAGGGGVWPALWMFPINVSWPPEIDVLEMVSDMSTAYMTYHWSSSNQQSFESTTNPNLATGFHTYAVEWDPGVINWYIDGVLARSSFTGPDVTSTPMGILIDIYLGGWAGTVTASFPQYMLVDYVRVYKRNFEADAAPLAAAQDRALPRQTVIWFQYCECLDIGARHRALEHAK